MKTITYTLTILFTLITFSFASQSVYADYVYTEPLIPKPDNIPGPTIDHQKDNGGARKILAEKVIPRYAASLAGFVPIFSVIFLIVAGVRFAMAYGNEESVENAKKQTIYALVGLVIAILSFTIVDIIVNLEYEENKVQTESTP